MPAVSRAYCGEHGLPRRAHRAAAESAEKDALAGRGELHYLAPGDVRREVVVAEAAVQDEDVHACKSGRTLPVPRTALADFKAHPRPYGGIAHKRVVPFGIRDLRHHYTRRSLRRRRKRRGDKRGNHQLVHAFFPQSAA